MAAVGTFGAMPGPHLTLQTERLTLRPLTLDDLDAMATLLGDAEALVLWWPADPRGRTVLIERNVARYASHGIGRCAVIGARPVSWSATVG
jgi:RimJ/RimL family protein N-acetyltransferase